MVHPLDLQRPFSRPNKWKADFHYHWDHQCTLGCKQSFSLISIQGGGDRHIFTVMWTCVDTVTYVWWAWCIFKSLQTSCNFDIWLPIPMHDTWSLSIKVGVQTFSRGLVVAIWYFNLSRQHFRLNGGSVKNSCFRANATTISLWPYSSAWSQCVL